VHEPRDHLGGPALVPAGPERPAGDQARFGFGDDALAAQAKELPGVRRWVGVEQCWSYANTGFWLAAWLAAGRGAP